MINCDEIYQPRLLLQINVQLVNRVLIIQNVSLNGIFGFEERFEGSLTKGHLFEFFLLFSPLLCHFRMQLLLSFTSIHCIDHALGVQNFAPQKQKDVREHIFLLVKRVDNLGGHWWFVCACQTASRLVAISHINDHLIFHFKQVYVHSLVICIVSVLGFGKLLKIVLLLLYKQIGKSKGLTSEKKT